MDSLIIAAAQALAAGNALAALNYVALRDDAAALAVRGIALARLGALDEARMLLRRAARGFGPREEVARARCVVAEAELALAARDLGRVASLAAARSVLAAHGEHNNAAFAGLTEARRWLLLGRLDEADHELATLGAAALAPMLAAVRGLVAAGVAMRRLRAGAAGIAIAEAQQAARAAAIPALVAEVEAAQATLTRPVARLITGDGVRALCLADLEALEGAPALIVDGCRNLVRHGDEAVALARRPVLFALARALAEAGPSGAARGTLLASAFGARHADESHRARLRVEIGRLRQALASLATITATPEGFVLAGRNAREIWVLARPVEERHASVLALLADGEAWSSSALALALGASQRQVQRALEAMARSGAIAGFGRGRARRWTTPPLPGIATTLLLPAALPRG